MTVQCKKHGEQPAQHLPLPGGTLGVCCELCHKDNEIEEAWAFPRAPLRHVDLVVKPEGLKAA